MRRARAGILAVVAVVLSAAAAFAQTKLQVVYGLSIPDRVGSLVYGRSIDFESKSRGLGYALRFGGWEPVGCIEKLRRSRQSDEPRQKVCRPKIRIEPHRRK